jgi:LuxR family maltose regulon positive regulatory protein
LIRQIEALLDASQGTPVPANELKLLRAQMAAMKAQYAYFSLQPDLGLAHCREALGMVHESWTYLRGVTMMFLSLNMQLKGESRAAERLLLEQYEAWGDKANIYALRLLLSLCFLYLNNADLDQVHQTARAMLSYSEVSGLGIMQGWAHFFLGFVLYQWNDLEAAEDHFDYLANHIFAIQALSAREGINGQAMIHHIKGELSEAAERLDYLSQIDLERMGAEANRTRSLRARFKLLDGDLETAARWADGFNAPPTHQLNYWLETPHLTQARIFLARNHPEDVNSAVHLLDQLADIAEKTHNTRSMIEIQALRALALNAQGKAKAALDALQRALDLARPGGFIRVFADLGPPMRKLLIDLVQTGRPAGTVSKILASFPESGPLENAGAPQSLVFNLSPRGSNPMVESLTTREREILIYLREPVSLKEIAGRLSLSYPTLKRHTANIYGKLGVNSRWDAVARANELGLLSFN